MEISLGESVAKNDLIIKKTLESIIDKEEKLIQQYKSLKRFEPYCDDSLKSDFEKLLEERELFIKYKLQSQEKQNIALYKLLEYLNTLEEKEKKIHIEETLIKMKEIEKQIIPLNKLLY